MLKRKLSHAEDDAIDRQLKSAQDRRDPVIEACGNWFFFGAWWVDIHGPFDSREEAVKECGEYAKQL